MGRFAVMPRHLWSKVLARNRKVLVRRIQQAGFVDLTHMFICGLHGRTHTAIVAWSNNRGPS